MPSPKTIRACAALLTLCGAAGLVLCTNVMAAQEPPHPKELDDAIVAAAKRHGVPEHLVRRVIMRESKYDPRARNHKYWGLMQISYPTAKSMGFKGTPQELLNPVVNLRYAVPYLANAFVIAGKRDDAAVRLYAAGYYFSARARGLLNVLRTAESRPLNGVPDESQPLLAANASAQPPQSVGVFGALFGPGSQPQPESQPQALAYSADASAVALPPPQVPAQTSTPAQASSAPKGTFNGPTADMVTDKKGNAAPPKKWTRDGGTTLIARGEQPAAAREVAEAGGKPGRHRSRKITLAAALDVPASSAQAYAAPAGQDPRFAATPSQAAIAQVTAGDAPTEQAVAPQPAAAEGQPATAQQTEGQPQQMASAAPQPAAAAPADDDKPSKRKRSRHAKHRKSHSGTQVAESKPATDEAATGLRPTTAQ